MRWFIILIVTVSLSLTANAQDGISPSNSSKLDWLVGHWDRLNTKAGSTAHERWEKDQSGKLIGWGVSMKGADTVFVEKLTIVEKDDKLYYVADVVENPQPVYFEMITVDESGFVCENPSHDFPKRIAYTLKDKELEAVVSDGEKQIKFRFVKR